MILYNLNHLRILEAEAIYVIRETAAQFENPVLLFSGGKDSIVMTHLARKAFWPARIPFPLMHIDTGHNFPETILFRDKLVEEIGANTHISIADYWRWYVVHLWVEGMFEFFAAAAFAFLLTTVGLGCAMIGAVALMSLVPMGRLKHIRVTDAFR